MSSVVASWIPYRKYRDAELEDSLRRAFVNGHADYVVLYSRKQGQFLFESAALGVEKGWLMEQECSGLDPDQDYELRYRLTTEGRKHFRLPEVGSV